MVENTQSAPPPLLQPPLEISPVMFNTAIFDRPNGPSHGTESKERHSLTLNIDPKDPHHDDDSSSVSSMRHDPFSSTAPATPPIYSPPIVNTSPYFFPSQTPVSHASTSTTLHPQSRTLSIQSLISVSTNATVESSLEDDEEERKTNGVDHETESVGGVSIEDPDVRMAAEALGDLRADFIHSPPAPISPPNGMAPSSPTTARSGAQATAENEPLLNLIGVAHPYIGQAVAAGRNVYRGGKKYSPRFRYGAEMVERAAGPMSSVVSFAAQRTGVEGVLRRRLEARTQNTTPMGPPAAPASSTNGTANSNLNSNGTTTSMEAQHAAGAKIKKRRKATKHQRNGDMEVDEVTSVADESEDEPTLTHKNGSGELVEVKTAVTATENWQRRLMLSTAGAGVALSEESLKSLKYCLEWLRWANVHLDKVIVALRNVLDEWDEHHYLASPPTSPKAASSEVEQQQVQLQKRIDSLRGEVVVTLKRVVQIVNTYAGGALPEKARIVVKACITNLPRRWALVARAPQSAQTSKASTPTPEDVNGRASTPTQSTALTVSTRRSSVASLSNPDLDNNRRVLLLAKEGLDMLHQVSSIVEGTLVRAEEWCDRLGRRKPSISSYGAVGWDKNDVEMRDSNTNGAPAEERPLENGESAKAA